MAPWPGPPVATKSRGGDILVGNIVPQLFASAFVSARIISKACIRRKWTPDDTMLCVAWALSIALTIVSCISTSYGSGIHLDELPDWAIRANRQLQYASVLLYSITLSLTKATVCIFYLTIFADPLNRRLVQAALVFIIIYTIPLVAVLVFQCVPIAANWDPAVAETAYCLSMEPHFWASAICNMVTDAWLAAQVVPNIMPLQIPRRQKMVLLFVVSLGWLVIVASIIRLVRIYAVSDVVDFTWASYDSYIWTAVEVDTGLVCVAAPATKPFFKKMAPGIFRTLSSERELTPVAIQSLRLPHLADEENRRLAPSWSERYGYRSDHKRDSLASIASAGTFTVGEILKEVDVRVERAKRNAGEGSSLRRESFEVGCRSSMTESCQDSLNPTFTTHT